MIIRQLKIKSWLKNPNKSTDNYVYIDESVRDITDTTTSVSTSKPTTSLLESAQDSKEENNNMLVTGLSIVCEILLQFSHSYPIFSSNTSI